MTTSRRRFLQYLAASPALCAADKPEDAINIMDFEAAARKALPPAHFGYIATGVEDDLTLRANREAFSHYQLRPRRLRDVSQVDSSVSLLGRKWECPLVLAPTGSHKAFHPDGELAVARAARSRKTLQILSTASTTSVEAVNTAHGEPVWYQLYATSNWSTTEKLVRRVEAAGCKVLVVTIDIPTGRKTETEQRFKLQDTRNCAGCHPKGGLGTAGFFVHKPMFDGIDMSKDTLFAPALTWDSIRRIRGLTSMKIVLKGIVTHEDATLSRENGVDGVIVSNHGGRAEESGRASLDCLPEVVEALAGSPLTILVDGGFRRGSDMFKALALGAHAVSIGRPYLWGLSAYGQPGVEAVIDMFRKELLLVMQQCGVRTLADITPAMVRRQA
jgi:4-hydroxymandelate oxidase